MTIYKSRLDPYGIHFRYVIIDQNEKFSSEKQRKSTLAKLEANSFVEESVNRFMENKQELSGLTIHSEAMIVVCQKLFDHNTNADLMNALTHEIVHTVISVAEDIESPINNATAEHYAYLSGQIMEECYTVLENVITKKHEETKNKKGE